MSHHTTIETEFKDIECVKKALDKQKVKYTFSNGVIRIARHDIAGARYKDITFTEKDGEIKVGMDSDDRLVMTPFLDGLKQDYAVALITQEAEKQNMYVNEEEQTDGTIKLRLVEY